MKTSPVPFLRAVVLTAVCVLAAPAVSRAENPLKNIGGKIKSGVSNVGSAIKNTAKAAKNIVTTGKPESTRPPAPRATVVQSSKPKSQTAGSASSKPKTTPISTKPRKTTTAEASYKPKPKTVATDSKPAKPKRKTPAAAADDDDKPKTRKKPSPATEDNDTPPTTKRTGKPSGDKPPEKSTPIPDGWIEVPDGSGEDTPAPAPAAETQPATPQELPFGTPAFGRKGFVYSPYAPDQGLIDVTHAVAGTKVRCPYTNKVFRVP